MGDRCSVSIRCRTNDLDRLWPAESRTANIDEDEFAGITRLAFEEVNYGHLEDSEDFPLGIPYFGHHSAGDNYGAMEIVSDGQRIFCWEQPEEHLGDGENTSYVFKVDDSGEPIVTDQWREYWAFREKVRHFIFKTPQDVLPETLHNNGQ